MNNLVGWNQIQANWVNQETYKFIRSLSFNGFILAGNSVANMVEKIPLQGDLDFWAPNENSYLIALNQLATYYEQFNIYPSMIQMYSNKGTLPRVNLIYTNLTPQETINRFDFDYCRCFWTPLTGVQFDDTCLQSIITKVIKDPYRVPVMRKRVLKAIKYGYVFEDQFWQGHNHLLRDMSRAYQSELGYNPIKMQDLNLNVFRLEQINLKISDPYNVKLTLLQLSQQYQQLTYRNKDNVKLPILLKLNRFQISLLKIYAKLIVFQNPLSDSNYLELKIDTKIGDEGEDKGGRKRKKSQRKYRKQEEQKENPSDKIIFANSSQLNIVDLNQSGSSFITIQKLPEELIALAQQNFSSMWNLHPKEKHKIIMFQKQVQVNRYSQSYLNTPTNLKHTKTRSYMYSGYDTSENRINLPSLFEPYLQFMKGLDPKYNQVIANWYENQSDFIAHHADCERGMVEQANVAIISFYQIIDENMFRNMEILPKMKTKGFLYNKLEVRLDNGSIVIMHGDTQQDFLHGIKKEERTLCQRLSLSFRQMK